MPWLDDVEARGKIYAPIRLKAGRKADLVLKEQTNRGDAKAEGRKSISWVSLQCEENVRETIETGGAPGGSRRLVRMLRLCRSRLPGVGYSRCV